MPSSPISSLLPLTIIASMLVRVIFPICIRSSFGDYTHNLPRSPQRQASLRFRLNLRSDGATGLTLEKKARAACSGVASSLMARVCGRPFGLCSDAGFFLVMCLYSVPNRLLIFPNRLGKSFSCTLNTVPWFRTEPVERRCILMSMNTLPDRKLLRNV